MPLLAKNTPYSLVKSERIVALCSSHGSVVQNIVSSYFLYSKQFAFIYAAADVGSVQKTWAPPPTGHTILFLCQPVMCLHNEEEKRRCLEAFLPWKEINIPGLPSAI